MYSITWLPATEAKDSEDAWKL